MAKRRSNGEGTVRQRADGKWEAYTPRDAYQKRRKVTADTQREVLQKLAKAKRDQVLGLHVSSGRQTLERWLSTWLETVIKPKVASTTHENYETLIRTHITPHIGRIRLEHLTEQHIEAFKHAVLSSRRKNHGKRTPASMPLLSIRTVRYVHGLLISALDVAQTRGYIERNVARLVPLATRNAREDIAETPRRARRPRLSRANVYALLGAIRGHRNEPVYRLMLSLGLRRGEALGLMLDDLDLHAGLLHVRASLKRSRGKVVRGTTKTTAGERVYKLGPVLSDMLRQHLIAREREATTIPEWQEHGYLFPSNVGTAINPNNLLTQFKVFLRKAELPNTWRVHDLRHACAVFLVAQGEHPRTVMGILGHTKIATTMDIYADVLEETQSAATDGLAATFRETLELPAKKEKVQ